MPDFLAIFDIIAIILLVPALASGIVARTPLSFPILFMGLGILLGGNFLGFIDVDAHSPLLEVVATFTLVLVLFLDAINLQIDELGRRWLIPALILGPGTAIIIALGAVPLALMLGFGWILAFLGGAILASTDPVVLRELMRDRRIPRSIKQILRIEAGTNDLIVLPIILILIAVGQPEGRDAGQWVVFLVQLLITGPAIGGLIGALGALLVKRMDARLNIRTEHQALSGIGIVLLAYTAATSVGGDGFLAAFAAGLAVSVSNRRLCNSFMQYGEVTSEMAMLFAFVLFGATLSTMMQGTNVALSLVLAGIVIFVIRPLVLSLVLARTRMSFSAKGLIAWFGPRGLNSLLLALLAVQANVPGAEMLLATVGIVVLASTGIHGASSTPIGAWYQRRASKNDLAEERTATADNLIVEDYSGVMLISPEQLYQMMLSPKQPIILDVRSVPSYERARNRIPGSARVGPDRLDEWVKRNLNVDRMVVAYCSWHRESSSLRAVQELNAWGITASTLSGGVDAWAARYPLEAIDPRRDPER